MIVLLKKWNIGTIFGKICLRAIRDIFLPKFVLQWGEGEEHMTEREDLILWWGKKVIEDIQQKKVVLEILGASLFSSLVGNSDTFLENNYFHKRNLVLPK